MTIPSFTINGNRLEIEGSEDAVSVDLEWPIAQVLPIRAAFIIRTDPDPGSCDNRNVCAIDREGRILWKVHARKHVYDDSPYTNIEIKDGKIVLNNWDGLTVSVDPDTLIEESEFYGR